MPLLIRVRIAWLPSSGLVGSRCFLGITAGFIDVPMASLVPPKSTPTAGKGLPLPPFCLGKGEREQIAGFLLRPVI